MSLEPTRTIEVPQRDGNPLGRGQSLTRGTDMNERTDTGRDLLREMNRFLGDLAAFNERWRYRSDQPGYEAELGPLMEWKHDLLARMAAQYDGTVEGEANIAQNDGRDDA